jgi:pimeloyl-ACP methyl ester carboxylesterase
MPKILVNGLSLHYWQSGQGPDIVLMHGLGGNLAGWHLTIVPELQRQYRITTYDLRGHGRSDAPRTGYTTRDMVEDLQGLMDALGIEQAHLVGHSWSGDIALHFALLHPHRVTTLIVIEGALLAPLSHVYSRKDWEAWPYITKTLERLLGTPIPDAHRYDLEYLLKKLIEIPIIYGPAKGRPRDEELVLRVWDVLRPMWNGYKAEGELRIEHLAQISHRTLLLYEANSMYQRAYEVLRQRLPHTTATILPAGKLKHFTGLEHPELILEHTKAFLQTEQV